MVICLERGADLHMAQLMSGPLTVSCFSKIQIGFTFLVPAHLGSPGKRAVKRVCVYCSIYRSIDSSFCFCHFPPSYLGLAGFRRNHLRVSYREQVFFTGQMPSRHPVNSMKAVNHAVEVIALPNQQYHSTKGRLFKKLTEVCPFNY